jgi:hypothetical protein
MINRGNIITWLLVVITSVVVIVFSYGMYTTFRPYNILEIQSPLRILNNNKEVKPGDILEIQLTYQKHYDMMGTITDHLVNGVVTILNSSPSNVRKTEPGEWVTFVRYVHIPSNTPPGQYYIRMVTHYEPTQARQVTQSWNSELFTVMGECDTASLKTIKREINKILKYQQIHKKTSEENNKLLKTK